MEFIKIHWKEPLKWSIFTVKLQSPTLLKETSITGVLHLQKNYFEDHCKRLVLKEKFVKPKVKVNSHMVNFIKKETPT